MFKHIEIKHRLLFEKLAFTLIVLGVYLVGRNLPLYGVDLSVYEDTYNAQTLLMQTVMGDRYRASIVALGIFPTMLGQLAVQVYLAFYSKERRQNTSPKKINYATLVAVVLIAMLQAYARVRELTYRFTGTHMMYARVLSFLEMLAGALIVMWLVERNTKYGIGKQTPIIIVNILDGFFGMIIKNLGKQLILPLIIGLVFMVIMITLEAGEKRIPMQRVSIHNIYADKNYLAIKLNPIGGMPIMFASIFFMLPQLILSLLVQIFPDSSRIAWVSKHLVLTDAFGIVIYIVVVYALTIGFSWIFLNPKDMSDQLLRSGDSIVDIHPGKDTARYISRNVLTLSIFSATVLSVCICGPMFLQLVGSINTEVLMLPSTAMLLAGLWYGVGLEIISIRDFDAYQPFI